MTPKTRYTNAFINRFTTLLIVTVIMFLSISGCALFSFSGNASADQSPVALAVVIAPCNCVDDIDFNSAWVQDSVKEAVETYGFLSVTVADGNPDVVCKMDLSMTPELKNATAERKAVDARETTSAILSALENYKADSEEKDLLKAIILASHTLAECPNNMVKKILILDSGLTTTGTLDFRNNLLSADTETLVDSLEERCAIPEIKGVEVTWQQLGDVKKPQQELSYAQKAQLKDIWNAILTRGGANVTFVDATPNPLFAKSDLPYVSPIDLSIEAPIRFEPCVIEEDTKPFQEPVFLDESKVKFKGDSSEYVDADMAVSTIRPIADYMISHPEFRILLIGATAGDSNSDYSRDLSLRRANAVKDTLVELGVSDKNIITMGLGSQDPWHVYGAGTGDDSLAASNRKVVILAADSEVALEILAS